MNLQPIPKNDVWNVRALCWGCGDPSVTHADLDGPPFKAYYCAACANRTPQNQTEQPARED